MTDELVGLTEDKPAFYPVTVANPWPAVVNIMASTTEPVNWALLDQQVRDAFPEALGFNPTGTDPYTLLNKTLTVYLPAPTATDAQKVEAVIAAHRVKDDKGNPILSKSEQKKAERDAAKASLINYAASANPTQKDTEAALKNALKLLGITNGSGA